MPVVDRRSSHEAVSAFSADGLDKSRVAMTAVSGRAVRRRGVWVRLVVAAMVAALALPAAAQGVQGPPDGFRTPQDAPAPAQGPADNGIEPIAPPAPRPQVPPQTQPAPKQPAPKQSAAPAREVPAERPNAGVRPSEQRPAPAAKQPVQPAPVDADALVETPADNGVTGDVAEVVQEPAAIADPVALPEPAQPETQGAAGDGLALPSSIGGWPTAWIAAGLALLGAACLLGWMIRRRRSPSAIADGPDVEDAAPPLVEPEKPVTPPPSLVAKPELTAAAPVVAPPPPVPVPVAVTQGRAKLSLTLQVEAIEMLGDAARISFSLMLANSGDRAAESGLVRIALQQANANQTVLLERFFDGAGGSVLADEVVIAPGDVGTVRRNALLPLAGVEAMMVGGYPSLIPVIGFDVTYHWSGDGTDDGEEAFGQTAAAFVLGTSAAADGRVAPVRLDLGPRRLNSPVSRVTGLERVR